MLNPMPTHVYGRKGTSFENVKGEVRGAGKPCNLEGCNGWLVCVRWPSGRHTWPCSKGMTAGPEPNTEQIE